MLISLQKAPHSTVLVSSEQATADLIPARSTANLLSEGWKPGARKLKCMCARAYSHAFVLPNDLITERLPTQDWASSLFECG